MDAASQVTDDDDDRTLPEAIIFAVGKDKRDALDPLIEKQYADVSRDAMHSLPRFLEAIRAASQELIPEEGVLVYGQDSRNLEDWILIRNDGALRRVIREAGEKGTRARFFIWLQEGGKELMSGDSRLLLEEKGSSCAASCSSSAWVLIVVVRDLTVKYQPSLTSIEPNVAPAGYRGCTSAHLHGSNFLSHCMTTVVFGSHKLCQPVIEVLNSELILIPVLPYGPGAVQVSVEQEGSQSEQLPFHFLDNLNRACDLNCMGG